MATEWNVRADELAAAAREAGRPTAWFEQLWSEAAQGEVSVPWDHDAPHPLLAQWTAEREVDGRLDGRLDGQGRRAVVVGCGLGADAEHVATLGFETFGFDLSSAAIRLATQRHPGSPVTYVAADVRHLPEGWVGDFDLVVEIYTLQAVPDPPRTELAAGVRSLVAPGGTLFTVQLRHDGTDSSPSGPLDEGPPYPQPRELFEQTLASDGLELVTLEESGPFWRAELRRG